MNGRVLPILQIVRKAFHRLRRDRRGNVMMIMAFSLVPMMIATGVSIDYARAARLQTRLNAAADAAALAAVARTMITQSDDTARNASIIMFKSQIAGQPGLIWNDNDLTVKINGDNGATMTRTAVVSYTAKSTNAFAVVLGMPSITIGGTATALAGAAPNVDFYLALDTSPSMALPTTSAGFTVMDNAVQCAFACHSNKIESRVPGTMKSFIMNTSKFALVKGNYQPTGSGNDQKTQIDGSGAYYYNNRTAGTSKNNIGYITNSLCIVNSKDVCVYNADGSFVDSYWYAINKGVNLRVTDERTAAQSLMTLAQSYAALYKRTYRAGLYTFDHSTNFKTIASLSADLPAVSAAAGNIDLVTVNDKAGTGCAPVGCVDSGHLFTSFKSALTNMGNIMPAKSGKGTNDPKDTPMAFMFIVTDGMSDEDIGSGRTRSQMLQAQIDQCTAIKNRGIQIAILYTEYTAASIADDEAGQRNLVTAAIPNVAPALTKCASPNLMYTVKTDQDISAALQALFAKALSTARITN